MSQNNAIGSWIFSKFIQVNIQILPTLARFGFNIYVGENSYGFNHRRTMRKCRYTTIEKTGNCTSSKTCRYLDTQLCCVSSFKKYTNGNTSE